MTRHDHPIYGKGIEAYLKGEHRVVTKIICNPTLSPIEKDLLRARLLNQKQDWQAARALLTKHGEPSDRFLAAELYFVRATAGFSLGHYEDSAKLNNKASMLYAQIQDRRGHFLSLYNMSADYNRLGLRELSLHFLEEAMNHVEWPAERSLVLRGMACHYSTLNDYAKACALIDQALQLEMLLERVDLFTLRNVAADIYVRAGKLEEALKLLSTIRNARAHRERARIEFQSRLLECLLFDKKLGPTPDALVTSEYLEKWRLLKALQEGEIEKAREIWNVLTEANPRFYGGPFNLRDASEEKSLLGRTLKKLHTAVLPAMPAEQEAYTKTARRLFEVLQQTRVPVRKEFLIEAIWGEKYSPEYDARFYKLVERFKRSGSARVRCVNRAYQLSV